MVNYSKKSNDASSSIAKSQRKASLMSAHASGLYQKCKAVRPCFLKIIRTYDCFKHNPKWAGFWQVLYKKSNDFLKTIEEECLLVELKIKEKKYINTFKKNLKKIKKMCQGTSISYYSLLPDKMPIDVRTYCVQFISQAKINK
jgi:hypothetical protein